MLGKVFLSDRNRWLKSNKEVQSINDYRQEDECQLRKMLDLIDASKTILIANFSSSLDDNLYSAICYARMIGKELNFIKEMYPSEIEELKTEHIKVAEQLSWANLDYIRHTVPYINLEDYIYFNHRKAKIFDAWISSEETYNGSSWAVHDLKEFDPFSVYGKVKMARFIECIIRNFGPTFKDAKEISLTVG